MIAHRARHLVPQRVLIVKPSALGDVVTALPVLRGLKRTFPNVHATWLVNEACVPLIAHDSQLDETLLFERKRLAIWKNQHFKVRFFQNSVGQLFIRNKFERSTDISKQ